MLLTVALLAIFAAYAFLIGSIEESWVLLVGGVVAVVASYGTAMLRPWSQYLVYALATGFVSKLAQSIIAAIRAGYFGFQFRSTQQALWSLPPSLLLVMLSCLCCMLVSCLPCRTGPSDFSHPRFSGADPVQRRVAASSGRTASTVANCACPGFAPAMNSTG